MKQCFLQITRQGIMPASEEDRAILCGEYHLNELIRCKTTRVAKVKLASVIQGNLLHACFKLLAECRGLPNMQTKEQVKFACKVGINFYHKDRIGVRPDGVVIFEYRSFAHDKLFGKERIVIVQDAFEWLADKMQVNIEVMVEQAKERMAHKFYQPKTIGDIL